MTNLEAQKGEGHRDHHSIAAFMASGKMLKFVGEILKTDRKFAWPGSISPSDHGSGFNE